MNPESLERSAAGLLASILAGGQWLPGLEGLMGEMNVLGGGIARIVHPRMYAIPTGGVAETFGQVGSGKTPTLTARTSMRPKPEQGFLADHIEIPDEVRRQDAFYQEFLRPRQCIFKTSAFLDTNDGGAVDLLIYRTQRQGAFQPDEMKRLGSALPYVRSAAMVTRGALGEAARRQAEPFERRGEPVLYLGADGRVREMNPAAERARDRLFKSVERRVVTTVIADQHRLDRALKGALDAGKPGLVTLHALSGSGRVMALVLPVAGQTRDVFHAVSSLVVLLEHGTRAMPDERSLTMLREATGLTTREADVVRVVAGGATPQRAAEVLGIGVGTVRLHLKAAYAKLGVHSQAELTTLVGRLN